jgi:flagellar motility protein MotE (MotC chaperone)
MTTRRTTVPPTALPQRGAERPAPAAGPRPPGRLARGGGSRARTLLFLSLCFIASAVVRLGDVSMAIAQTGAQQGAVAPPAPSGPREPTVLRPDAAPARRSPTLAEQAAACDAPPGPLLVAIRERVQSLDQRELRIAERESLLEVTEARIRAEIGRLEEAERRLAATLALADGASERDVAHLVGVYETMKPKNAAVIFTSMDPRFAAGFLSRMRADAAASILGQMEASAAYAVTAVMAGRHVGAGQQPETGMPSVAAQR